MRFGTTMFSVFAVGLAAVTGCTQVVEEVPTAPVSDTYVSTDPGDPGSDPVPLEGLQLCEMDTTTNCVVTDANGEATLWLPVGPETGYTRDGEGQAPFLTPVIMPAEGLPPELIHVPTVQFIAEGHSRVGSPYPMRGTGTVVVALAIPFAGVTFELDAATGVPFYEDEERNWDPDLTATTVEGRGGFTEVTPGEVQINIGGSVDNCIVRSGFWGWPSGVNSVRAPVREGYVTHVNINCPLF